MDIEFALIIALKVIQIADYGSRIIARYHKKK
ncbi:hypothetical protein SAMN04488589_1051 [Methanolobus vulcani]|uniref:Uncharacterized protein n=1 Tax=Methanolobus vulcani TaxID=38026 RepID=A0A7Z7AVS0_9EURY|nr:hypothetical protein SAMN04488589_1051 [Methanolobus vulcani]